MPKKQAYKGAPPVRKTGSTFQQKLRYDQKFDAVTIIPLISAYHERILKKIQYLNKILLRHSIIWNKGFPSQHQVLQNYVQYYHEYFQYDQFDSQYTLLPSLDVNLYTINDSSLLYKSQNIYKNCPWAVRFGTKFAARVKDYQSNQIYYILSFIMMLAEGNFYGRNVKQAMPYGYVEAIQHRFIPYNRFLKIKIFRQKTLLFNVGVQKVPIVRSGVIKRYQYRNYIQFLDILSDQIAQNNKKLHDTVERFAQIIIEDVAKKDHSDQLVIDVPKNRKKQEQMFEQSVNPYTGLTQVYERQIIGGIAYNFKPFTFKPHYTSLRQSSTLIFNKEMKRWVSSDYLSNKERKAFNQYQRKVNEQLIKRFLDFKSAKTLVQLLTKIPNFRVSLTEQQKDVIGQNGNVLAIGRSGTGKTTCAVLRLFAIEMLFKIRLSLFKKKFKSELKDTQCSADDINQSMGLHCIFLTASPVLINQIQRYYKKLTDNIKNQLQKKHKKSVQQKRNQQQSNPMKKTKQIPQIQTNKEEMMKQQEQQEQQEIVEIPEKIVHNKSKQEEQQEEQMNQKLGGLTLEDNQENQGAFDQQENLDQLKNQFEEKMKKFKSLEDLEESDYPGFFTVKSFIMMIDASLKKPFFIRKKQQQSTQTESQATWHNQKKGVMMIQNYYKNQQENQGKQAENIQQEIDEEINYSDEEQLEHQYMRQIQLRQNKEKQKLTEKLNKTKKALSFQVDYDYFYNYFWPTVRHRHFSARNITPHLVWTQIFSTIKGGASSHLYPGLNLTQKAYISQSANVFLTKQEKLDIFETYCQYQRWKIRSGGYDLMDAVNYILHYIRFRGFDGPEIHYIMIDQVQDLPHAIIYLLSKTVRYGVFYSGDTAQTIAKGIGFRFCDLKNLFDPRMFDSSLTLTKPVVKQLTVNFRSHNNILQLANSVVSSIQILFPKTIDRLNKQISNIKGPKPIILSESDEQLLFYVLCGDQSYKKTKQKQDSAMKKPPLQFGCDQVIIVRDQESKERIPSMLQHALCLTIYEAKGLQFNDVILYNFFDESKCKDKWNLIKFLKVVINQMDRQDYQRKVTKHENQQKNKPQQDQKQMQSEDKEIEVDAIVDQEDNSTKVFIKKIISDAKIYLKDINDYAQLCSELKMLYTAITRPRKTLIIYDEDSSTRKPIQKLWQKLEVVELVTKEIINDQTKKIKQTQEVKIFKSIVNSTDSSEWKKQGLRMFNRGYFEQAMKCFGRSGDQDLFKKAEANMIADNASKRLIQIQSERSAIKNHMIQYQKMSQSDLSKLKKKLKKQQARCYVKFTQAGSVFESLLLFKQAGQCYFSGKMFQKAYENFSKAFMHKQAAQSLEMLNKYRQAAQIYENQDNYLKVIECYDLVNEWQIILHKIQKFSHLMSELQKQSLFKKYSALALQQLVYEIQFENQLQNEAKPQNNRIQIIKEQQDSQDQDDWDEDDDPQVAAEKYLRKRSQLFSESQKQQQRGSRKFSADSDLNSNQKSQRKSSLHDGQQQSRKQSLIEQDKIIQQSIYENIEQKQQHSKTQNNNQNAQNQSSSSSSFADLNQSDKQEQIKEKQNTQQVKKQQKSKSIQNMSDSSFADIMSQQSSFADLNSSNDVNVHYPAELQPDIQSIRSMADSEDPWIRSAISQINAKTHTQYSIIDESQNYNPSVRIIKTKGNIFVQDQIMKKIISIVSIVNSQVQEFFKHFKGYQSLISVNKDQNRTEIIDNRPEISDFEDIDPQFINIILDTLESFKLHKLCLFVCNRYHMPHKAGRYLLSMALKYSTSASANNILNPSLIAPSLHRKAELQKGILASIALHAIFENVSADFLKIKVNQNSEQNKNSLGSYFVEGLVLEGIYKKAVFVVNTEQSLKMLWNFSDFNIYQSVFKQKVLKLAPDAHIDFLQKQPKTAIQQEYSVIKMQSMLFKYNCVNKAQIISQRFYRQFHLPEIKADFHPEVVPNYYPYLAALFSQQNMKITQTVSQNIQKAYQILRKGPYYSIYDIVGFLIISISRQSNYSPLFHLQHSQFLQVYRCLQFIRHVLYSISITKTSFQILESIFSAYSCKIIKNCKSMKFVGDGYSLIKRTSVFCNYFVQQIKKNKDQCAYFFQQDYNHILVRTETLLKFMRKKFDICLSKFLIQRSSNTDYSHNQGYLHQQFKSYQTQIFLKYVLSQQGKQLINKKSKKNKNIKKSNAAKKKQRPNFSYKNQGRVDLVVAFDSEQQQYSQGDGVQQVIKTYQGYKFTFPDLNPKLGYLYSTIFNMFNQKSFNEKNIITGQTFYCSGLNDAYKQYTNHKGGYNLYDAIEFRKFKRIDFYADNILSVINDISMNQKPLIMSEIILLLLIQYKFVEENRKQSKLKISRDFLKFFPNLILKQAVGQVQDNITQVNQILKNNLKTCIFDFGYEYSSELNKQQIGDLLNEFIDIIRIDDSYKNVSIENLITIILMNMPYNASVYENLRLTICSLGNQWSNPIFDEIKFAKDLQHFTDLRAKLLSSQQHINKYSMLHELHIRNISNLKKSIQDSQNDYQIKQKILEARKKAANKIAIWWKMMKMKLKPKDQDQIRIENRIIRSTYQIKYLPFDDRFLLRSSNIRNTLICFYLSKVVTSSLDFHFILMTLNKIHEMRQKYIKVYAGILTQYDDTDFQAQISNIQQTVDVWKKDSKWLKQRNIDLKRKKVFQVKWMTRNNIHNKIIKKRAGLKKQKNLEQKKKNLKKRA